jgi:hypothetical protein
MGHNFYYSKLGELHENLEIGDHCNRPRYLAAAAVLCNRTCLGDTVARRWSPSAADVVSAAQFDCISQGFWEFWESRVFLSGL